MSDPRREPATDERAPRGAVNVPPMPWRERIQAARERGWFTSEDDELANDFSTCAVHEARMAYGLALEPCLAKLGMAFTCAVISQARLPMEQKERIARAENILDAIEDRALQLKRETFTERSEVPSAATVPASDEGGR